MKITRMKLGEGPETADRIFIDHLADDRVAWTGSVDVGGSTVFGYSQGDFATTAEAEASAVEWAKGHGATEIMIEADD